MTIPELAELHARLEKAVAGIPGPLSTEEIYERWEGVCQATIDSPPPKFEGQLGLLTEYCETILYLRLMEYGLHPDYPASE